MALSETAKLIASLELQDKFSKPAARAESALGRLNRGFGQTGKGLGQVSAGLGTAAVRVAAFGAAVVGAGIGFLAIQVRTGIDSLRELENAQTQTSAVIASTKGVAGQTAESIRALSERFEDLNATLDDKVIQSGANLLLTFTNIRKEAFEPTLQAALDMNQAMGGGEEGLQNTIIQLGKALQDPIKGIGALRRVGVNFSEEQRKQIKILIEQNDLYGAQQIILKELATEFGGSFAAAGTTATARTAKLKDKIEELQQALARPIVPVIDMITNKLIALFDKPATAATASRLGEAIAGIFTDANLAAGTRALEGFFAKLTPANFAKVGDGIQRVFGFLREVPWKTIGEGLRITGQAAKVAVDAFLSLPKEVQGIAIAALAVNKLSGGLVGTGIGTIGKGLANILLGTGGIFGRGASPAHPVWVQSAVAGVGGGVPVVGGLGSTLLLLGPFIAAGITGGLIGAAAAEAAPAPFGGTKLRSEEGAAAIRENTAALKDNTTNLGQFDPKNFGGTPFQKGIFGDPKAGVKKLPDTAMSPGGTAVKLPDTAMSNLGTTATETKKLPPILSRQAAATQILQQRIAEARNAINAASNASNSRLATIAARVAGTSAAVRESGGALNAKLGVIAGKIGPPSVFVKVVSNVTISEIQRKITSQQIAVGKGPLESF